MILLFSSVRRYVASPLRPWTSALLLAPWSLSHPLTVTASPLRSSAVMAPPPPPLDFGMKKSTNGTPRHETTGRTPPRRRTAFIVIRLFMSGTIVSAADIDAVVREERGGTRARGSTARCDGTNAAAEARSASTQATER